MKLPSPAVLTALGASKPQVFSDRVGCQVFRPQDWGFVDLAALCLRGKS